MKPAGMPGWKRACAALACIAALAPPAAAQPGEPGAMQARLDVVLGNAQHVRDLSRRQTFHLPENDDRAVRRGQLPQRLPQTPTETGILGELFRAPSGIAGIPRLLHPVAAGHHGVQRLKP